MNDALQEVIEEGYVWPEGVCPAALDDDKRYCPLDGGIKFSSDIEGNPIFEGEKVTGGERCPECGSELEIKFRFKFIADVEDLPEEIRENIEVEKDE